MSWTGMWIITAMWMTMTITVCPISSGRQSGIFWQSRFVPVKMLTAQPDSASPSCATAPNLMGHNFCGRLVICWIFRRCYAARSFRLIILSI